MLTLTDVNKTYRTATVETVALAGVNLQIAQGDFVAIMGPSGCGKSTLLNILGMLDEPDGGSYRFLDRELVGASPREVAALRMRYLGFVFQSFNLIDDLTVQQNIELPLLYQRIAHGERKRRASDAMDAVGLGHRAGHRPSQLSGGQQQRVAIARAIVTRSTLILADEPTGNLDSSHGEMVMELLRARNAEGATIVMVTHSSHDSSYATRTVQLLDGRILAESASGPRAGTPLPEAAAC